MVAILDKKECENMDFVGQISTDLEQSENKSVQMVRGPFVSK